MHRKSSICVLANTFVEMKPSLVTFNFLVCSPLNSNFLGSIKFVLIIRFSNYKFSLNIKRKYNGLSRNHNHLSELTGLHCIICYCILLKSNGKKNIKFAINAAFTFSVCVRACMLFNVVIQLQTANTLCSLFSSMAAVTL